jgi:16S rRNA (adenine1518-N6/adenine1519-N6)-dimethyltransferase
VAPTSSNKSRRPAGRRVRAPRELREAGLSARKTLGQHFLRDAAALRRIADAVEARPNEAVIEIGAGLGALTERLAERAQRVVAIELDDGLAAHLRQRFGSTNVTVVHGDALALDPVGLLADAGSTMSYAVAGNLPYQIAQPLLRHYLEAQPPPRRLVVMVQAEVAESIVAAPGAMTLLGLSVQVYGEARILFRLPPSAFYPPPRVRSAVVRIDVSTRPLVPVGDIDGFFAIARAGFTTRRKQLRNALANGLDIAAADAAAILTAAGIDPKRRAQELRLEDWVALARAWSNR